MGEKKSFNPCVKLNGWKKVKDKGAMWKNKGITLKLNALLRFSKDIFTFEVNKKKLNIFNAFTQIANEIKILEID